MEYYGDRTCSARRPPQANWWCPAKKDTTLVANCSVVGESRLKPPPSAADCCVVGELRLKPPPPHEKNTHSALCYVCCVLPLTVPLDCVWRVLRVLRVLGVAFGYASGA